MVFELDSFSQPMSEFTLQVESSIMQEGQIACGEWSQGEKKLTGEVSVTNRWQERETLPDLTEDNLYWRAQEKVSPKAMDDFASPITRTLEELEVCPQNVQLVGEEREDLCKKYLKDDPPFSGKCDTEYSSQVLPPFIGSYSENLSSSPSEEFQRSLENLPLHTNFISLHKEGVGYSQNTRVKSESCRYPTKTNNWLYRHQSGPTNQGVYWNRTYSNLANDEYPSYVPAHHGSVNEQETADASSLLDYDAYRSQCLKCSNAHNEWKQSFSRDTPHISSEASYFVPGEPEISPESSDFHGKRSLQGLLEYGGLSIPSSLTEFDGWRQEINAFLKCNGLSRREFAKTARIGKNTVGKYLSGQCKKLSREIVWKILSTYQKLLKALPMIESEQSGPQKSCKRRRIPKIQKKQTITSQSINYSCIQTEWDRINRNCDMESESYLIDQAESSGSISFGDLKEQLLFESCGNLPMNTVDLFKEGNSEGLISKPQICTLQECHTGHSCLMGEDHHVDNDMKQLVAFNEDSIDDAGLGADEQGWVGQVDEEIYRCYQESVDTALRHESVSSQNYLSCLLQSEMTTACEPQPQLAEYNYCPNSESSTEATFSYRNTPIQIELHLPTLNEGINFHTRLSRSGEEENTGTSDNSTNDKYNKISYISESTIRAVMDYQQICITDAMGLWQETVELRLNFGNEIYCGNFVLHFPVSEEFIRLFARQLCMNFDLDFAQVGVIVTSIIEQLTEVSKSLPNTILVEGAFP
ncbi:hypothetical protein GpartN1_g362.t1 [Galdieria partita]|uniref:HTH cro/C1-type domain-containing protein n=1 Tax=Galdieria partita TaxID=83374 RepID=A0A9C7PQL7_9RHOD|nr:hypothetical protein GpartN1_g362.t1 [Galdieria partita]